MNTYEEKQAARKERLEAAAIKASQDSQAAFNSAQHITANIPLGQPILVGHHSERHHRADLARSDNAMRKCIEADNKAKHLASKAASVGSAGISSDDPDAISKLEADLQSLQDKHDAMKEANRIKKGSYQSFQLTNSSANLRRIAARIKVLKASASKPAREPVIGQGWRIVDDHDINRTCVEFDAIPCEAVRAELKAHGFHWNRSRDAWTRMISEQAWHWANRAVLLG